MTHTATTDFDLLLSRYADLLVRVGVNLPAQGKLYVSAPLSAAPLVRQVVRAAYGLGALDVITDYHDEQLTLALFEAGSDEAVAYLPEWAALRAQKMLDDGYARLAIRGDDPNLLSAVDPERVAGRNKKTAQAMKTVAAAVSGFAVNWCVAAMSTPAWAARVYPELPEAEAVARLWQDIFAVTRADQPNPVAAWDAHLSQLERLTGLLTAKQYAAIHLKSELGTDLTVGLADGHLWQGGAETARNGIRAVPNLPTDEVFTAPHRDRVDGWAVASKPLSVHGQLVQGIRVRFEGGRVAEVHAEQGQSVLEHLIATDEGAARLGELALVRATAPVAQTGTLFFNTLFDENAASHIALGRCYPTNVRGGSDEATLRAAGGNDSLIHVDWMIGTPGTDVDGLTRDGGREPLMRGGEWVI